MTCRAWKGFRGSATCYGIHNRSAMTWEQQQLIRRTGTGKALVSYGGTSPGGRDGHQRDAPPLEDRDRRRVMVQSNRWTSIWGREGRGEGFFRRWRARRGRAGTFHLYGAVQRGPVSKASATWARPRLGQGKVVGATLTSSTLSAGLSCLRLPQTLAVLPRAHWALADGTRRGLGFGPAALRPDPLGQSWGGQSASAAGGRCLRAVLRGAGEGRPRGDGRSSPADGAAARTARTARRMHILRYQVLSRLIRSFIRLRLLQHGYPYSKD